MRSCWPAAPRVRAICPCRAATWRGFISPWSTCRCRTAAAKATVDRVSQDGRLDFNPIAGSEVEIKADLVLLAMGFLGPERGGMLDQLGVRLTDRGNVWRDEQWMTSVPGVFTAGDMQRGQSLIVWAIAEGRSCARGVDAFLMGASQLPAPLL